MEDIFSVTILRGQKRAKDDNGIIYHIHGMELIRPSGHKVYYDLNSEFYKAAAAVGTTSKGYLRRDCTIMLL